MEIGVLLVTYNRLEKLKIALERYENQTVLPKYILVVNNSSTDGTKEFLNSWKNKKCTTEKYVINTNENIGGSGGFYTGFEKAIHFNADWIWVSDDDAYPYYDALEKCKMYVKNSENKGNIAAVCGQVINKNKIDISHRRRINKGLFKITEKKISAEEYKMSSFQLDLFSYVGTMINKEYLKKCGLPEKEYFIYYDDTEHSYRLSEYGKIICIPEVKVSHDFEENNKNNITWKKYYAIRNRLLFFKKHFHKRYFYIAYLNKIIQANTNDKFIKRLILDSIRDAKREIKGLHDIYKPGWIFMSKK